MAIKVLFFGQLTEVTGCQTDQIDLVTDLEELSEALNARYPELHEKAYKWAVNERLVNNEAQSLKDGDQVALLPPFAGG